jgi:hypothetical protein
LLEKQFPFKTIDIEVFNRSLAPALFATTRPRDVLLKDWKLPWDALQQILAKSDDDLGKPSLSRVRSTGGRLPLHEAARNGAPPGIIKRLVQLGKGINECQWQCYSEDAQTVLALAVRSGRLETVWSVLELGAKATLTDVNGRSLLKDWDADEVTQKMLRSVVDGWSHIQGMGAGSEFTTSRTTSLYAAEDLTAKAENVETGQVLQATGRPELRELAEGCGWDVVIPVRHPPDGVSEPKFVRFRDVFECCVGLAEESTESEADVLCH